MSEQTKSDEAQPRPQAAAEEAPQIESAPLAETDLENISGGVSAGSSIQKGGTGYAKGKIS